MKMPPLMNKQMVSCPACGVIVCRAKLRTHAEELHMGKGSFDSLDLCCTQCDFQVEHRQLEEMALHYGQSAHHFNIEWEPFILREEHRITESAAFFMEAEGDRQEVLGEEMKDASDGSAKKRQKRRIENVEPSPLNESSSPNRKLSKTATRKSNFKTDELTSSRPASNSAVTLPRSTPGSPPITNVRTTQQSSGISTASIKLNLNMEEADEFNSTVPEWKPEMTIPRVSTSNAAITTPHATPPSPAITNVPAAQPESESFSRQAATCVRTHDYVIQEANTNELNTSFKQEKSTVPRPEITNPPATHPGQDLFSREDNINELTIKQEGSKPRNEEDKDVSEKSFFKEKQVSTPKSPSPSPSPTRMRGEEEGEQEDGEEEEEEVEETPRARKRKIKTPLRGIHKSKTGDGCWFLQCKLCNKSVVSKGKTSSGVVRSNGVCHAISHLESVYLFHCTRCDNRSRRKGDHKKHWQAQHSEEEWTTEGSLRTILDKATKAEVVQCVQACFPERSWGGIYQGINFLE